MKAEQRVREFTLEKQLGVGGAGEVWLARHTVLNKPVAIKILHPQLSSDPQIQKRFQREAQIMSRLEHHNILSATDCFTQDDLTCLVMPYMESGSLAELIDKRGRLSMDEVRTIMECLLDALDYAHRQGIIHRDVKPSNILINEQESEDLKVTDFGIAKLMGQQKFTETRTRMGTIEYMSPEQIKASKSVDQRTDVYSCGCVCYELLTGQPPFGGRDEDASEFDIMQGHVNEAPRPLRDLNPEVDAHTEAVVLRALAKNPDDRYGGCKAMQQALMEKQHAVPAKKESVLPGAQPKGTVSYDQEKIDPTSQRDDITETPLYTFRFILGIAVVLSFLIILIIVGKKGQEIPGYEPYTPAVKEIPKIEEPSNDAEIQDLLAKARVTRQSLKLTTPIGNNAYEYYKRVLTFDPLNEQAQLGISRIAEKYVDLANTQIARGNVDKANTYLVNAAQIDPNIDGLVDADTQYRLGQIFVHGLGVEIDLAEGLRWYDKAARQGNINAINGLAWLLATATISSYRDGYRAIALAQKATDAVNIPIYIDTKAAAYAETRQFSRAIEIQEQAKTLLDHDHLLMYEFVQHLKSYQNHQPWREVGSPPTLLITIHKIEIYNSLAGFVPISANSTTFQMDAIRYIYFSIDIDNVSEAGTLGIKYIYNDRVKRNTSTSPPGLTHEISVQSGRKNYKSGWGNDDGGYYAVGNYRIEFWWKGRKVGEKNFTVK